MGLLDFIGDRLKVLHKSGNMPTKESKAGFHFVSMEKRKAILVVSKGVVHTLWDTENYKTKAETDLVLDDHAKSIDILSTTKAEVSQVQALVNGTNKLPAVDTYNDTSGGKTSLLSSYPTPKGGDDVLVRKDETKNGISNRYCWNSDLKQWVDMETGNYAEEVATKAEIDTRFFQKADFNSKQVEVLKAIQNVVFYGTTKKYKLITLINNAEFPYRVGIYDIEAQKTTWIPFGGSREVQTDLGDGAVLYMYVDWDLLGSNAINMQPLESLFIFSDACYNAKVETPTIDSTITAKKIFEQSPEVPTPKNEKDAVPYSIVKPLEYLIASSGDSKNMTVDYLKIINKLGYNEGHNFNTDIELDVKAPEGSGIITRASSLLSFAGETNKYFYAVDNLLPYLQGNSDNPDKILFEGMAYNSHSTSPITISVQFRYHIGTGWLTSIAKKYTINPLSSMLLSVEFDRGNREWTDYINRLEVYCNTSTLAVESDPVKTYFGNTKIYYQNATGENIAPVLNASSIKKGIAKWQLSDKLIDSLMYNSVQGRVIATLGDSIIQGMRNSANDPLDEQTWERLRLRTGAKEVINCGIGGSTWFDRPIITSHPTDQDTDNTGCISNQILMLKRLVDENNRSIPDIITMSAGTNHPKAARNNNYDDVMALSWEELEVNIPIRQTFYGGVRYSLELAMRYFPNATIILFSPIQATTRTSADPEQLRTYENLTIVCEAIKKMAGRYSVHYVDCLNRIGISDLVNSTTYLSDGVHLTGTGRRLMTNFYANEIANIYSLKAEEI